LGIFLKLQRMELSALLAELQPYGARLVAVSKTQPLEAIQRLYDQGQRDFAENRVQDLLERKAALPADIRWHLIGHLQTNKVKYIADFVHCIHSVDSLRLLEEIDRQAQRCARVIDVLIQLKVAQEETKYGLSRSDAEELLQAAPALKAVRVCGVMGMASFVDDEAQVAAEFDALHRHFMELKAAFYPNDPAFCELSMGMSGDYPLALRAGSTLVRVGSLLF
jgi:hypothetical protein